MSSGPSALLVPAALAVAFVASQVAGGGAQIQGASVETVAGGPVRLVWLQHLGDGRDPLARGDRFVVKSWQSSSRSERIVTPVSGAYAKPLLTPDARFIVYSSRREPETFIRPWDGGPPRSLGAGVALTVWRDQTQRDWVFVGLEPTRNDPGEYQRLERFPIDAPERRERVAAGVVVNEDNFDLAPDGRLASGVFPWPRVGWLDVARGTIEDAGEGCWAGLSPSGPPLLWFLDDAHRRMTVVPRGQRGRRWTLSFEAIAPLGTHEVYHPRWTSSPRHFVVTGPYLGRKGWFRSAVRDGGTNVEIFLGRLDESLTRIEAWAQLTRNDRGDFYPAAWVARGGSR